MFISTNWIRDFVDLDGLDVDKLIYNFTMSTAEVEQIIKYGHDTDGVVVGKIEKIEEVENSDKLHRVLVDVGTKKVISICGASNIYVGAKIPFASAGAKVQGMEVKQSTLDNMESFGICLSEKELGISDDHSGVMILDGSLNVGEDIKNIIPLEDTVFEVDNKSLTNRPDLWGHYGIAREFAAITKRELKPLDVEDLEIYNNLPKLNIKVENGDDCLRYSGITLENINCHISPYKIRTRLFYTGLRSINLLADLTNYIMLEIGQPMHAFDKRFVDSISVSKLREECEFTTLDGVKRKLPSGVLMINNNSTPSAIAGIMGGLNTEIKDDTTSVFLESATFDSTLIRKTAIKIAHRTDASARYEKTLDPEFVKLATARFVKLLKQIDGNVKVTSAFTDVYLKKYPKIVIDIDKDYFERYIGVKLTVEQIVETLRNLKFEVECNGENLKVSVPTFRATKDISIKADLVEEVARIYGYDNIIPSPSLFKAVPVRQDEIHVFEYDAKRLLAEKFGASEIHSYVWYNKNLNSELNILVEDNLKVTNALSKGDDTLRAYMAPTLLYAINNNLKYYPECKLFEIGRTFEYKFDGANAIEKKILGIASASTKKDESTLMYEVKSMINSIFKIEKNIEPEYVLNNEKISYSWINKKNTYIVNLNGIECGYISCIHPRVNESINKKSNIVVAEIRIDNLSDILSNDVVYSSTSKYQTTSLDLSVIVDKNVAYSSVKEVIDSLEIEYLLGYEYVGIYENEEKLGDKKSITIKFNIGSHDKTLSKEEIDEVLNILITTFEQHDMIINK